MAEVLELEVKSNIGDVSKGIDKATKSTENLVDETKKIGSATGFASKGFKKLGTAVKGIGTALKAAGIGLAIAIFVALKEAVERNQAAMDLLDTVMGTISTTFNQVVTVLSDVVSWVTESSDRFDGLTKVVGGLMTLALTPLKLAFFSIKLAVQGVMLAWEDSFLGGGDEGKIASLRADMVGTAKDIEEVGLAAIEAGKDIASNIGDAISEVGAIYEKAASGISEISIAGNYELAKSTTAAVKSAKFAQAEFAKLNAQKLKEAEEQRQIRDDETKTFAERIEANNKLNTVLEEQQKLQREQVQIGIRAAALAVQQNGSDENKLALMEAQNAELELEEAITGQMSEQKTNQVALEKELLETQRILRAEGLEGTERELEELRTSYEEKLEMARKAGVDDNDIKIQYENDRFKILKEANAKEIALEESVNLAKKGIRAANLNNAQAGISLLKSVVGDNKALQAGLLVAENAAGIAKTIISTQAANAAATLKYAALPGGLALAAAERGANNIAAGISIAASIAATTKGLSALGSGGGVSGGNVPSGDSSGQGGSPAPQMMSGSFDISGAEAPEPVKAFVLTDEMSNSQNQLANIRRRATI